MITINGNKISANQTLKPNGDTKTLDSTSVTIKVLALADNASSTKSYTITDQPIHEIAFNVSVTQWDNAYGVTVSSKTFSWKNLQTGVVLHDDKNGWQLKVTCYIENTTTLKFTYEMLSYGGQAISDATFRFTSQPTIHWATMVDDLTFQDGALKISSIIDYQEKIEVGSNKSFTLTYNCLGLKRTGTGAYGAYSWVNTMEMYTKGTSIKAEANQKIEFYVYLVFKNPED